MKLKSVSVLKSLAASIISIMAAPAIGQSGAFEINQACVADGCFPGDEPGFPVSLAEPGTYILTSNLTVIDPNVLGIDFGASNIALDLNRFSVSGPVVCTGEPATCDQSGPAVGVNGGFHENLRITNGTVSGFSQWGVVTGPNSYIINIVSRSNFARGIVAREGTQVLNSKALQNEGAGISLREDSIARGIIASGNGTGITMGCSDESGCNQLISGNVSKNALGIFDWGGSLIMDTVVSYNLDQGIENRNGASSYVNNSVLFNGLTGISVGGGSALSDPALPVVIRGTTITGSQSNVIVGSGGTLIDAGGNVCGFSQSCPD
mgnify:CR=1 FL=1